MARTVRDSRLESRSARLRLPQRKEPHWRTIEPRAHLGYYRGARGGTWIARLRQPDGGYAKTTLGTADDVSDADGSRILSFAQAQDAARRWFERKHREFNGDESLANYRVADAMRDYAAWLRVHRRSAHSIELNIDAHILPALGSIQVAKLTPRKISDWLITVAAKPPRRRVADYPKDGSPLDPELVRRRRATANRILSCLKAGLNLVWHEGRVASDDAWRRIKPFRGVDQARIRYLTDPECRTLIGACDADFGRLVMAALLTGMRYGELTALRVGDFDRANGLVHVIRSKSGKPRHVILTDEGRRFFELACSGKQITDIVFTNEKGGAWGKSHQHRPLLEACGKAAIEPAISFHILRHTYASRLVMAGVPVHVVSHNLGHSDTRMTLKHYAHLAPTYLAQTLRALTPELGLSVTGASRDSLVLAG